MPTKIFLNYAAECYGRDDAQRAAAGLGMNRKFWLSATSKGGRQLQPEADYRLRFLAVVGQRFKIEEDHAHSGIWQERDDVVRAVTKAPLCMRRMLCETASPIAKIGAGKIGHDTPAA